MTKLLTWVLDFKVLCLERDRRANQRLEFCRKKMDTRLKAVNFNLCCDESSYLWGLLWTKY